MIDSTGMDNNFDDIVSQKLKTLSDTMQKCDAWKKRDFENIHSYPPLKSTRIALVAEIHENIAALIDNADEESKNYVIKLMFSDLFAEISGQLVSVSGIGRRRGIIFMDDYIHLAQMMFYSIERKTSKDKDGI